MPIIDEFFCEPEIVEEPATPEVEDLPRTVLVVLAVAAVFYRVILSFILK